jgi:hypothetical protein
MAPSGTAGDPPDVMSIALSVFSIDQIWRSSRFPCPSSVSTAARSRAALRPSVCCARRPTVVEGGRSSRTASLRQRVPSHLLSFGGISVA